MKKFYSIMKTKEEVEVFLNNYNKYRAALPKLVEQVNAKAMHADNVERDVFTYAMVTETEKLEGTIRSTLTYSRNHADDGMSAIAKDEDTLNALKRVSTEIRDFRKAIDFAIEQAKTTSAFHDLARGIIPEGYTNLDLDYPAFLREESFYSEAPGLEDGDTPPAAPFAPGEASTPSVEPPAPGMADTPPVEAQALDEAPRPLEEDGSSSLDDEDFYLAEDDDGEEE